MPSNQSNNGGGQPQQTNRCADFDLLVSYRQGIDKHSGSKQSSGSQKKPMSTYEFVKPWGGMVGFMTSYGLKPTPEGFEEAQELIAQFKAHDAQK